jgi:hypothetical protein
VRPDILGSGGLLKQLMPNLKPSMAAVFDNVNDALAAAVNNGQSEVVRHILAARLQYPEEFDKAAQAALLRGWKPTSHVEGIAFNERTLEKMLQTRTTMRLPNSSQIVPTQWAEEGGAPGAYLWTWEWHDGNAGNWEGQIRLDIETSESFHFDLQVQPVTDVDTDTPWMSLINYDGGTVYSNSDDCPSRYQNRRACVQVCMRDKIRQANWLTLVAMGTSSIACLSRLGIFAAAPPFYFACWGVGSLGGTALGLYKTFGYDQPCDSTCAERQGGCRGGE